MHLIKLKKAEVYTSSKIKIRRAVDPNTNKLYLKKIDLMKKGNDKKTSLVVLKNRGVFAAS